MFEPVHGSAPTIVGQGIANPLAAILSAGMMLNWLGKPEEEARIEAAVMACLQADKVTPELGGTLSTSQVGDAVVEALQAAS